MKALSKRKLSAKGARLDIEVTRSTTIRRPTGGDDSKAVEVTCERSARLGMRRTGRGDIWSHSFEENVAVAVKDDAQE